MNPYVPSSKSPISNFIEHHYRHFNAATVIDAAEAYKTHLDNGGKMLRHARRRDEHGRARHFARGDDPPGQGARESAAPARTSKRTSSTWCAHDHYERVPHYRDLTPADEADCSNAI